MYIFYLSVEKIYYKNIIFLLVVCLVQTFYVCAPKIVTTLTFLGSELKVISQLLQ